MIRRSQTRKRPQCPTQKPVPPAPATNTLCSTCLSANRQLFSLADAPQYLDICNGLTLKNSDMICYECRGRLCNIGKFRERALRAQAKLSSLSLLHRLAHVLSKIPSTKSLSTLSETVISPVDTIYVKDESAWNDRLVDAEIEIKIFKVPEVPSPFEGEFKSENAHDDGSTASDGALNDQESPAAGDEAPGCTTPTGEAHISGEPMLLIQDSSRERESKYTTRQIDRSEVLAYLARERDTPSYKRAPYKCTKCVLGFRSETSWRSHNEQHCVKQGPFICDICERRYSKQKALKAHTATHYIRYECSRCARVDNVARRMERHYHQKHGRSLRSCSKCDATFTSHYDLSQHGRTHYHHRCDVCRRMFGNRSKLRTHIAHVHRKRAGAECGSCHKKFIWEQSLMRHISRGHCVSDTASCAACNLTFDKPRALRKHLIHDERHGGPRWFECDYCGKRYDDKVALKRHMEWNHIKLPTIKCDICGEGFVTFAQRRGHKRKKHSDQPLKLYVCHVCGKAFSSGKTLDDHMNTHLGVRPYSCETCGATFASQGSLYCHTKRHLKGKLGHGDSEEIKEIE